MTSMCMCLTMCHPKFPGTTCAGPLTLCVRTGVRCSASLPGQLFVEVHEFLLSSACAMGASQMHGLFLADFRLSHNCMPMCAAIVPAAGALPVACCGRRFS